MSDELIELEEEEYTSQLTTPVFKRIVTLLKPHWKWVVGFLITITLTSVLDAYFTYLNKQIIDQGIMLKDKSARDAALRPIYGSLHRHCRPALCSRSFTWRVCWASASNMTCARCSSITCRTSRFRIMRRTRSDV